MPLQKVLSFIHNNVNPIGFEVDELGKSDSGLDFGHDYIQSPEYILDSDDFLDIKIFK